MVVVAGACTAFAVVGACVIAFAAAADYATTFAAAGGIYATTFVAAPGSARFFVVGGACIPVGEVGFPVDICLDTWWR